jgi:hypothetical protein
MKILSMLAPNKGRAKGGNLTPLEYQKAKFNLASNESKID